ncbi:MAG: hypothetical protein ABI222_11105 [Opitutaceae bacterium]
MSASDLLRRLAVPGGLALWLALAAGCENGSWSKSAHAGSYYAPANHSGDAVLPSSIRRVVLLPLCGGQVVPESSVTELDPVVAAALQQQNRFEIISLSRDDCIRLFGASELSSVAALPANFMATLRQEYAADAVLLVDITVFHAYRPLSIGFRAKLATVQEARLVWTFDNLFSAADPMVINSARRHVLTAGMPDTPADQSAAVLQSPSRFAAYAAETMFATLPPVSAGPNPTGANR